MRHNRAAVSAADWFIETAAAEGTQSKEARLMALEALSGYAPAYADRIVPLLLELLVPPRCTDEEHVVTAAVRILKLYRQAAAEAVPLLEEIMRQSRKGSAFQKELNAALSAVT